MFSKSLPFLIIRNARPSKPFHASSHHSSHTQSPQHHSSYNRKEKSLEELSRKFLQMFLYSSETFISLDKITDSLGVERRRIYDIINILESLNLVTRKGKNNYRWNGFRRVYETIQGFESLDFQQIKALSRDNFTVKREKSLKILSIGFLGLFLQWKTTMTLEEAAKSLNEGLNIEDHKIKTKIRRLYDIANVFKSLGLIRKTLLENKKPAFHWLGVKGLDDFVNSNREFSTKSEEMSFCNKELLVKCLMSLLENKSVECESAQKTEKNFFGSIQKKEQSFVTPIIKKTLTIIYPKNDENQSNFTPSTHNSLQKEPFGESSMKNFEPLFKEKEILFKDSTNCSNILKRRPLNTLSQNLNIISRQSSFKKIKREINSYQDKENVRPLLPL